jgi:peptide/nickel transport system substrate-binding protein
VKKRPRPRERRAQVTLYGDIQRQLANDAVNAFIFNPAQVSVSRKGLKGLWASSPIFANDMAAVRWGD